MRKLIALGALCLVALAIPGIAKAWKPYTHNFTGTQARNDAVDGTIAIGGRTYSVPAPVRQALADWPSFYNAGVVGPDGFPDLTMGQSEIHPVRTGAWLKYILDRAWAAQTDASYSADERAQILAFAYGFLTHAAGDMWAHTLVNEFARGVFPGVGEIVTSSSDAEIAIRHLIVEGYIGNATPGFDNNEDRTTLPDGDVSDDSSPGVAYDAPIRWIYETLVRPDQPDAPSTNRGPLINFFWSLQANLQVEKAKLDFDKDHSDCALVDPDCDEVTHTLTVNTILGVRHPTRRRRRTAIADVRLRRERDRRRRRPDHQQHRLARTSAPGSTTSRTGWSTGASSGSRARGRSSTRRRGATSRTRSATPSAPRRNLVRINCENGISALDTLFARDGAVHQPPPALDARRARLRRRHQRAPGRDRRRDRRDRRAGSEPAPPRGAEIKDAAKDLVKDLIEEAYGVDVDQLADFLMHPTHWLNVTDVTLTLPGVGPTSVHLFDSWVHPRLDSYMHLPADHHEGGGVTTELADDVEFSPASFAAIGDTITMAKLLLLSPSELNRALGDSLVAQGIIKTASSVQTYPAGGNVMYTPLAGNEPWLQLIDGDHSWRQDGLPVFCDHDKPATCALGTGRPPGGALLRTTGESQKNAGNGQFPIWESCLLRPAFRTVFVDWENNGQQFPDLGDGTSPDPSDPNAPDPNLALSAPAGHVYTAPDGTVYAAGDHTFTASATEDVFVDADVHLQYRYFLASGPAPGPESGWTAIAAGGTFRISGADGLYKVQIRSADPCHTFATDDALPAGTPETSEVFVDSTPPVITISSPANGTLFDTDDFSTTDWSATDPGSGVASTSGTFDGAATTNGATLDMFYLYPGAHTVKVGATDNVGNSATKSSTFQLHATSLSLLHNVQRACGESGAWPATPTLITKPGICAGMESILTQAVAKHASGDHATERKIVAGWVDDVDGQRGKAVDTATADRFIAYGKDLIATGG